MRFKMKNKSRKVKEYEYYEKYGNIPIDYSQRLNWMYDYYKISDKRANEIINKRDNMINSLYYRDINLILFESPEATPRPRFRLVNRSNFMNAAIENSQFVHVYNINAKEDTVYMNRLVNEELLSLNRLISTPIIVEYCTYYQTPKGFNTTDVFLSEIGIIRPLVKPDWDNIGKKYSDMSNENIWLDDSFVIEGTVKKYYSILPRIEIKIKYLNMVYNKYQYNSITNRKDYSEHQCSIEYFKGD